MTILLSLMFALFTGCGDAIEGDCFVAQVTPFCSDMCDGVPCPNCCTLVCAQDPVCCDMFWDGACVSGAMNLPCGDPPAPFCPADLNFDGFVGVPDLLQLLAAWGQCPQ